MYCAVLYMVNLLNSLVGGAKTSERGDATAMLTQVGAGQQCSTGNAKFPQTVECFSSLSR